MKLVNLIPLKEIDFRNQDQFDDYQKQHSLRPDTKVTIAGKPQTVAQASKNSEPVKGSSVFGKDKGASVFGKTGGETPTVEPDVKPQYKVQDLVKNLSGKQYKEFAFDNDIDHRDPMEMQDFISSLSDEEAATILKKYGQSGEAPKVDGMATVNSIAAKTGLRAQAVAGWADENGVNLSKVAAALKSKKIKPMDLMTAVVGNPNNKYAKDIIAKYSQNK